MESDVHMVQPSSDVAPDVIHSANVRLRYIHMPTTESDVAISRTANIDTPTRESTTGTVHPERASNISDTEAQPAATSTEYSSLEEVCMHVHDRR